VTSRPDANVHAPIDVFDCCQAGKHHHKSRPFIADDCKHVSVVLIEFIRMDGWVG